MRSFSRLSPTVLVLGALVSLAGLLRLLFIGEKGFRLDEATTVTIAGLDWPTFVDVVANQEANMSLFYVLLRFWLGLGESESVVRTLSALSAVATVPAIYALGARLFGSRVGLVAALLLSVNALHITYAQKARGYGLLVLLVTLSCLFFVRIIERPSRKDWIGYIVTGALAVYAHFFGALILVSHWLSLVFLRRREVPWRGLIASSAVIGALVLPLVVFVFTKDVGQVEGLTEPGLRRVLGVFGALAGGDGGLGRLVALAYFVFCLGALIAGLRSWRASGPSVAAWRYAFLLTWLFAPVILARAVSFVKPIFAVRFLSICLPPLAILAAVGISRLRPRWVFAGALVVVVVLAVGGVAAYYQSPEWEDWQGAVEHVLSQARSGDAVVFYVAKVRIAFENYRRRSSASSKNLVVVFPERWEWSILVVERLQAPDPTLLERLPERYDRVWLILSHDEVRRTRRDAGRALQAALAASYPTRVEKELVGVKVLFYSKAAGN